MQYIYLNAHQAVALPISGYSDEPVLAPVLSPVVLHDPVLGRVPNQQDSVILCHVGLALHDATLIELPVL